MGGRTTCAVYLSEKPLSWYQPGMEILRVDVSGLDEMKATTFLPESDEILFWGDIPAWKMTKDGWKQRITLVTDKYVGRKERIGEKPKAYCGRKDGCAMCDLLMCDGDALKCVPCQPTQPECGECEFAKDGDVDG